jgi:hypothetical protein
MGLAPLGCLPLWEREGVTLAIALSALWEGILQSPRLINSKGSCVAVVEIPERFVFFCLLQPVDQKCYN